MKDDTDQPWIDRWPTWDEPLSKFPSAFDIDAARERLARKFNRKPVRFSKAVEIERSWQEHGMSHMQRRRPR